MEEYSLGLGVPDFHSSIQREENILLLSGMSSLSEIAVNIAENLIRLKAVKFQPHEPFTWASGWKSPIYTDNRLTLSDPAVRKLITEGLTRLASQGFPEAGAIAGVATAGIPQGVLLADRLSLPFLYVRPKPKNHGMGNQIEGKWNPDRPVLVVEDLVSTGGSSLAAVTALQSAGAKVCGMVSIFSYGFTRARTAFEEAGIPFLTLCTLEQLISKAIELNYICDADRDLILAFRQDPEHWKA